MPTETDKCSEDHVPVTNLNSEPLHDLFLPILTDWTMPTVTSKGRQPGDCSANPVSNQSLLEPHPDHLVWTLPLSSVAQVDHPTHSATSS